MKKYYLLILFLIIPIIAYSENIDKNLKNYLGIDINIADNDNELFANKSTLYGRYKNTNIRIIDKYYKNSNVDEDYFSSERMIELYKSSKNGEYSYLFSVKPIIHNFNNTIVVDYFVFSMFELSDIRLERFLIIFTDEKATIIQLEWINNPEELYDDLLTNGYIVNNNRFLRYWKNINKYCDDIREKKTRIKDVDKWYDDTNEIEKCILKYINE